MTTAAASKSTPDLQSLAINVRSGSNPVDPIGFGRGAGLPQNPASPNLDRNTTHGETTMSAIPNQPAVCACLRAGEPFVGKQGFSYAPAISAETVGASAIHMQFLTIPPGARAKAHKHQSHETALHVLSGEVGMWYGERLEHHMVNRAGDFVYIPANVPHMPYNLSESEPATAVVARTDPNEQESVILLPELEAIHA
jgi:uncharacterized RmlC-like cupin family protein